MRTIGLARLTQPGRHKAVYQMWQAQCLDSEPVALPPFACEVHGTVPYRGSRDGDIALV